MDTIELSLPSSNRKSVFGFRKHFQKNLQINSIEKKIHEKVNILFERLLYWPDANLWGNLPGSFSNFTILVLKENAVYETVISTEQ